MLFIALLHKRIPPKKEGDKQKNHLQYIDLPLQLFWTRLAVMRQENPSSRVPRFITLLHVYTREKCESRIEAYLAISCLLWLYIE